MDSVGFSKSLLSDLSQADLGRCELDSWAGSAGESRRVLAHGPKRWRYSPEMMKAFTISALTKLPPNSFNLFNQNS